MPVTCPHCRGGIIYAREAAGTPVGCPHCGKRFEMPATDPDTRREPAAKPPTVQLLENLVLEQRNTNALLARLVNEQQYVNSHLSYVQVFLVLLTVAAAVVVMEIIRSGT